MELVENVVAYLKEQELALVTAESCTAGLIASEVANVPGSGQVLEGGLVVYSPEAKKRYLAVASETIEAHGLTSQALSREMALRALDSNDADIAVAVTGLAGPDPCGEVPSGTLCFAWAFRHQSKDYLFSETRRLAGSRNEIRLEAAHYSLAQIPTHHKAVLAGRAPPR
ncbi:CinA family protein [Pistricoccus aurantiacus]|uniref:CinA family protein n=1 Tax=Pistricoccus aurantiacus TaxID=1883414 RepID=UPI0036279F70